MGGVERGTVEIAAGLIRRGHRAIVVAAGGRMVPELLATGAEHLDWEIGRKHPATLLYVRRLRALYRTLRPDIVHVRSRLPAWINGWALAGIPPAERPRLVATCHGPYTVGRYSAIMTRGERVIAISEFIRDYLLTHYPALDPARITVIPRGVDRAPYPHGYQPSAEWLARFHAVDCPAARGRPLLVLPARLTRWKGQEDFLALLRRLKDQGVPVYGAVVGGAHPRQRRYAEEIQGLAARLGLAEDVCFLGHRTDLREILATAALSLSLTGEPEAFGRTTIEALSLGTPVVGYDHGGTGEILRAVYPAGLTPFKDPMALAATVTRCLRECQPVPAEHGFLLGTMVGRTLDLYEALAASPRPG
jgi:glycosyltransferase involved in cell wall biosynthesis